MCNFDDARQQVDVEIIDRINGSICGELHDEGTRYCYIGRAQSDCASTASIMLVLIDPLGIREWDKIPQSQSNSINVSLRPPPCCIVPSAGILAESKEARVEIS